MSEAHTIHSWSNPEDGDASAYPYDPLTEGYRVHTSVSCKTPSGSGWVCTRTKGHSGRHVAHFATGVPICAWWDFEGTDGHDLLRAHLGGLR